jgi:hypothetical protein
VVQNGVPRPASETSVLQMDAGKSKLAITARMHRRRLRDPQESQLVASAGVLNPNGIKNCGVCMKWSARRDVPDTGRINAHARSRTGSIRSVQA